MLPLIRVAPFLVALLFVLVGNSKAGAQTEAPGVIYDSGFYNEERLEDKSWRWMDEEGAVKLKNGRQDMILKIVGRAPVDAMPGGPPIMKIFLNGEQLEQFTPSDKIFEKEYKVSGAQLGNGTWSELKITTTKVIVPSQRNKKSKDDRHLGFKLYALTWHTVAGEPMAPAPDPALDASEPPARGPWLFWTVLLIVVISLAGFVGLALALWLRKSKADLGGNKSARVSADKEAGKKGDKPHSKSTET